MGSLLEIASLALFLLLVTIPSLYAFHMYVLMYLAHRRRAQVRAEQQELIDRYQRETPDDQWPLVTTQLPLYNEINVARRIIEAAAGMDYPAGRHEIQVLDDSTDGTRGVVDQVVAELQQRGVDIRVIRRPNRDHYKAGALEYGVRRARGELIAIFDADFVPQKGFLRRMVPLFSQGDDVCVVQGRWGHLNSHENWVTEGLSLSLDFLFAVEQGARNWNGLLMGFNGTGGMWRKAAIEDPRVGGWSGDTITEDLDLSYRAQLAGWRMVYCVDEVSPAELPADVNALKSQQNRWAVGTIQTARKLLPAVWRSKLSLIQKLEASFHMAQYAVYLPMLAVAAMGRLLPLNVHGGVLPMWTQWYCSMFLLAAIVPAVAHIYARRVLGESAPGPVRLLKLVALGLGLCVNNAVAVATGFFQRGGEFVRTPKSGGRGRKARSGYARLRSELWLAEILLGTFCFAQWLVFLPSDGPFGIYLLLYAVGLLAVGWSTRPEWIRRPLFEKVREAVTVPPRSQRGETSPEALAASSSQS